MTKRLLESWNAVPYRGVGSAWWLAAAAFAVALAVFSGLTLHRVWGCCAAVGYLAAATLAGRTRSGVAAPGAALAGAVLVPLAVLLTSGRAQSEVGVIARSAATLLRTGTPYLPDPQVVDDYNPYLPGTALLGLPARLFGDGWWAARAAGDPRLWCAGVLLLCLVGARAVLRRGGPPHPGVPGRAIAYLVASPAVALPLCVSGVDLPLTGLLILALALAARRRPVATGLALAAACSLKWTALPAVAVAAALLTAGQGEGGGVRGPAGPGPGPGRRAAVRCLGAWVAGTSALVLPALSAAPGPLVEQVLLFPTGRGAVPTPAASPLPGRLMAGLGPAGQCAAALLLLCAAVAVAASLVAHPPRTLPAATDRLALGLTAAFLLAPAGRYGYLALPLLLAAWGRLAAPARPSAATRATWATRADGAAWADGAARLRPSPA
ncbi:hypothetical protein ACIA8O_01840 [Kitasatospora sp. NPDC051853]|uniref:hypothetical protein n=1 Tax=Kitasatospora sp. NPDC051853 TaxID=3364058 RepID=UPI00379DF1E4